MAKEECKLLYPQLTDNDCHELFIIKRNYKFYDYYTRKIADTRLLEIKFNLLPDDEKVQYFGQIISSMKNDHIPVGIIQDLVQARKSFINLPKDLQEEIVGYVLKVNKNSLSTSANDYLDGKLPFIMPKNTR